MTPLTSDYALEIIDLNKAFGGLRVTQSVSLAIRRGERHLIIGPNGAGKTTLFNQISGDMRPNSGQIKLLGTDVTTFAPYKRAHLGLSRTYQIITLLRVIRSSTMSRLACSACCRPAGRCGGHCRFTATSRVRPAGPLILVGLLHLADHPVSEVSPMAKSAGLNSRWRWRKSRACCSWTSRWRVFQTPNERP